MNKIKVESYKLKSVTGEILEKIPDSSKPLNIDLKHVSKIKYNNDNKLAIMFLESTINPIPKSLFQVKIIHEIRFSYEKEISGKELFRNSPELSQNLGTQISHLVSIITKELIGTNIILPPNMNFKSIY